MKLFSLPILGLWLWLEATAGMPTPAARLPDPQPAASDRLFLNTSGTLEARVRYRRSRRRYRLPNWGSPRWSTGGAARGGCDGDQSVVVIPLMPVIGQQDEQFATGAEGKPAPRLREATFFGVTTVSRPTFFAYVPPTSARQVEFLLQQVRSSDRKRDPIVFPKTIEISGKPQIISVQINQDLKPNVNYRWSFTTICNPNDTSLDSRGNPFIEGLIQWSDLRNQDPKLQQTIQKTPLPKLPELYAANGLWMDALTTLAQLRCQSPSDPNLLTDWTELVNSMELGKIPNLSQKVDINQLVKAPLSTCTVASQSKP